jgi:N-formylglutamate amidohydrolase
MKAVWDRTESLQSGLDAKGAADLAAPFPVASASYLQASSAAPPWFDPDDAAFNIAAPQGTPAPVVFASPHSGRRLPPELVAASRWPAQKLAERLGRLEDRFVDEIFADAPLYGATLLTALIHRAYVDLNREPYELDQTMFADDLPAFANVRSPRVAAGLGAIARCVGDSGDIYARKLTLKELEARLSRVHRPYHHAVENLLKDQKAKFGQAILLDCHSMPSSGARRPADIVLGDRYGASCAPWLTDFAEETLTKLGFVVARNAPYAGGYVTQTHGAPQRQIHALQVEVRRDLYMDEQFLLKCATFADVRAAMARFASILCGAVLALDPA